MFKHIVLTSLFLHKNGPGANIYHVYSEHHVHTVTPTHPITGDASSIVTFDNVYESIYVVFGHVVKQDSLHEVTLAYSRCVHQGYSILGSKTY